VFIRWQVQASGGRARQIAGAYTAEDLCALELTVESLCE
jgi:hypothetical protein